MSGSLSVSCFPFQSVLVHLLQTVKLCKQGIWNKNVTNFQNTTKPWILDASTPPLFFGAGVVFVFPWSFNHAQRRQPQRHRGMVELCQVYGPMSKSPSSCGGSFVPGGKHLLKHLGDFIHPWEFF